MCAVIQPRPRQEGAFKLKRGGHTGCQATPQDVQQIGQEVHVDKGQVGSDIPQAGTATSEDKEVRRLSTEDTAEDRELEQILSEQECMVIRTDEVMAMKDAQPQALQRYHRIVVFRRYVNLTGHRIKH